MLRVRATVGDLAPIYRRELKKGRQAAYRAMDDAGEELKLRWRQQIRAANLGEKLANTIRHIAYPNEDRPSWPATTVFSKAPKIVGSFDKGPTIRASSGSWLAIPLPGAGRGRFNRKPTPDDFMKRTGLKLRFVQTSANKAVLVADDVRFTKRRGDIRRKGGRRRKDGILSGAQSAVVFALVKQVRLRKRLDLSRDALAVGATLDRRLVEYWGE